MTLETLPVELLLMVTKHLDLKSFVFLLMSSDAIRERIGKDHRLWKFQFTKAHLDLVNEIRKKLKDPLRFQSIATSLTQSRRSPFLSLPRTAPRTSRP